MAQGGMIFTVDEGIMYCGVKFGLACPPCWNQPLLACLFVIYIFTLLIPLRTAYTECIECK